MSTPLSRSRTVAIVSAVLAAVAVFAASLVSSGALVWDTTPQAALALLMAGCTLVVVAGIFWAAYLIMRFVKAAAQQTTPLADHLIAQLGLGDDSRR